MTVCKKMAALLVFALLVAVSICSAAFAAAAPEEKVGAIEPQSVLFQHPKYEQTMKQIQNIADQKQNEFKLAIEKESDDNKKAEIYRNMRMAMSEEEGKLMAPLFKEIDMAVRAVATAKKITVVVDKTAVFYGATDITDDVVQELKKKNASGG